LWPISSRLVIAKHTPDFADPKGFSAMDADGKPILVATHASTMGEWLSHNAGFTYKALVDPGK
jgi:hypothetical protein